MNSSLEPIANAAWWIVGFLAIQTFWGIFRDWVMLKRQEDLDHMEKGWSNERSVLIGNAEGADKDAAKWMDQAKRAQMAYEGANQLLIQQQKINRDLRRRLEAAGIDATL